MALLSLLDNRSETKTDITEQINDISLLSNKSIKVLQAGHNNLLIFPQSQDVKDIDFSSYILSLIDNKDGSYNITTNNLMGFVGVNSTQIKISSRFQSDDDKDYFLHYLLQKVFDINIFDLDFSTSSEDSVFDFLLYIFPYYLKKAVNQGLYKEYKWIKHNDSNIKGTIDIARHVKFNEPFCGKIAYNTREHSFDNHITELIRHTIEYIKQSPVGKGILQCDSGTKDAVTAITQATTQYDRNNRIKVINSNIRPVKHPYFTNYTMLQKACMQILKHEGLKYDGEQDKIHGILFDGAWLWEEYLGKVLEENTNFTHCYRNKGRKFNLFHLFSQNDQNDESFQQIIPDYISDNSIADAKYIPLNNRKGINDDDESATAIYYKTITYMHSFGVDKGYLFYPAPPNNNNEPQIENYTIIDNKVKSEGNNKVKSEGRGTIIKCGIPIPKSAGDFNKYVEEMKEVERKFLLNISN